MTLNVSKEKLTILDVQFDNFIPTTESVLELKNYVVNRRKELQIG